MAELINGQKVIFKHPHTGEILTGVAHGFTKKVLYCFTEPNSSGSRQIDISDIREWCDAEAAWNALTSQNIRAGNFEWNEGPTVEPKTI